MAQRIEATSNDLDRDAAALLMRHVDAIGLLHAGMLNVLEELPANAMTEALKSGVFKCVWELETSVARPIASLYPDLDLDRKRARDE